MAHVLEPIRKTPTPEVITVLREAHAIITSNIVLAETTLNTQLEVWGISMKRLEVSLPSGNGLIGKPREKFVELINILATTERTISALVWLDRVFPTSMVLECHPSTSDDTGGNDIVIAGVHGAIVARCEVCDVASSNPGQNGKEKKDLLNLGCASVVPDDGVRRFIATSYGFAKALSSASRKWDRLNYRYIVHRSGEDDCTTILEIVQP